MGTCDSIGISGGCDLSCSVFREGKCEIPYEFDTERLLREVDYDELGEILELYPDFE